MSQVKKTYMDEFRLLSSTHPTAAGFTYSRYNTQLQTGASPDQFSLTHLINSARIANEWEDGKYIVNTSRVETAWLHYPAQNSIGLHPRLRRLAAPRPYQYALGRSLFTRPKR
ncbi:glycosyltransferase family 92 domain-containing protein [Ditylenchus destructor]|uniref:Glycosyltransferase family 92 protein n=1 Tax=Ditylenchus destructor TaxID=166010 RepID=A0AAD4MN60_9BILA|nr:glycosyltransferase family 92 domain-containing protein [Ditylenchus destructor]